MTEAGGNDWGVRSGLREVTADELYRILQDELDSFVSFVKEVMAYLDTV